MDFTSNLFIFYFLNKRQRREQAWMLELMTMCWMLLIEKENETYENKWKYLEHEFD